MGGSLSLGAAMGAIAIILKKEILLVIIGGVSPLQIVETVEVIVPAVIEFKFTNTEVLLALHSSVNPLLLMTTRL